MPLKVNFGGTVPFSTIDWRGKASMVIFLRGCPLQCIYCHNYKLLEDPNYVEQEEIEAIAEFVKKRSLFVAVQTNGFYPAVVETLLEKNLIDKIFLDIKAPLSDGTLYEKTTVFKNLVGAEEVKRIAKELEEAV